MRNPSCNSPASAPVWLRLLLMAGVIATASLNAPAETFLLTGATVHTVSGETFSPGQVLVRDGKIAAVGKTVAADGAAAIDLHGQHLYPGIIALNTVLGLTEINAAAWETLRQASPINHLRAGMPPYLLIQGDLDRTVVYEQAVRFQKRSRALGNRCDLTTITNGDHGMEGWDKAKLEYKSRLIDWLKKTL